ncbi:Disease resistance protein [Quillaja saponaria]|uniref:Disease resistance protein n=1 Tax=Quillaja saponaria TaxID=32244 RepID=A0AAD7KVG6_QUISA|nr:Disease resistance protein [Quillaja saponaria]
MLLTLLLQQNSKLMTIPQSFFENMSGLLVLDLYRTKIGELPSSLSNLTSLKGLYLNDCLFLTKLPPQIEALRHLEVLDIRGCKIHFMSFYISYLVNLRCLRISYIKCSESQDMESDCEVIAKLQQLEELIIEVDSCEYDHWCNEVAYVIQQVASLENLRILRFCFPGFASLQYFIKKSKSWRDGKFTSFRFFVGCPNSKRPQILECFEYKINRYMKYRKDKLKDNCIISEVLTETDAFELICHKSITKLSDFVGGSRFRRIRSWLIESCNKMSTIVDKNFVQQSNNILLDIMMDLDDDMDESDTSNGSILPNLEQLFLKSLLNLKTVFEGPLHPRNLSKLQILEIINCPILERIFINGSIWQLSGLKKLTIQDCYEIEELITEPEGTETECIVLTKLETLALINLPKLNTVCLNNSLMWPSLEVLKVHGCPELKTLPFSKDNATSLRFIRGQQEWWNQFKRPNNEDGEWLQSIFAASGTNAMHVEENIRENRTTMHQMIQEIGSTSFNNVSSSLSTTQNEPPQEEELLSMASRVKRIKV